MHGEERIWEIGGSLASLSLVLPPATPTTQSQGLAFGLYTNHGVAAWSSGVAQPPFYASGHLLSLDFSKALGPTAAVTAQ